jgi:hypothetical protein
MSMKRTQLQSGPLLPGFCQQIVIEILGSAISGKNFDRKTLIVFHHDEIA